MIRMTLLAGAAALWLAPTAIAQSYNTANCERIKDDQALVGGLIGAVAGGVLGAAIADGNDNHYRHDRYRGYRGYRGYRRGHYRHDNDGNEVAGALIGGVLGAVAGSAIATSGTNCTPMVISRHDYDGVPGPTKLPYGPAWNSQPNGSPNPPQSVGYGYGQRPLYGNQELYGGQTPNQPPAPGAGPARQAPQPLAPDCQMVQRETRLPDSSVIREPVEVCRTSEGRWEFQAEQYGY